MSSQLARTLAGTGLCLLSLGVAAQPAGPMETHQCAGTINGIASQSVIQLERANQSIYVAGTIQNAFASYTFNGEMFGGVEGFIILIDMRTGERNDRVYIAMVPGGYLIQPEGSPPYTFACR